MVVVRAVGSVERIYNILRKAPHWETLVLLKGPGWEKEWLDFKASRYVRDLKVIAEHSYAVPVIERQFRIVKLARKAF